MSIYRNGLGHRIRMQGLRRSGLPMVMDTDIHTDTRTGSPQQNGTRHILLLIIAIQASIYTPAAEEEE